MKRKEIILNISLILLIALAIFQSNLLWIEFSKKSDSQVSHTIKNSRDLFKEFFKPKKMIANFGNGYHSVYYSFDDIYSNHDKILSDLISAINKDAIWSIPYQDYLKLQNEKSIVYKFNKPLSGNIFLNMIGLNKSKKANDISITEIYISNNRCFVANATESFEVNYTPSVDINNSIDILSKNGYVNYKNLYELYSVAQNIYYPEFSPKSPMDIYYLGGLMSLDRNIKNNMAERFLDQKIDYIREITQAEGTTFVYQNKFLKLWTSNAIEYENQNSFKNTESNLYSSLESAVTFIATRTGQSKNLYLSKVEPISDGVNYGYKLCFDLVENHMPVILSGNNHFIEIESYSTNIKKYKQLYIKSEVKASENDTQISLKPLDKIIQDNIALFDTTSTLSLQDIVSKISDISLTYLDVYSDANKNKLIHSLRITYDNRELYFSLDNSAFIMER